METSKCSSYRELPKISDGDIDVQKDVLDHAPLSGKDEDGIAGYVPQSFYTD